MCRIWYPVVVQGIGKITVISRTFLRKRVIALICEAHGEAFPMMSAEPFVPNHVDGLTIHNYKDRISAALLWWNPNE